MKRKAMYSFVFGVMLFTVGGCSAVDDMNQSTHDENKDHTEVMNNREIIAELEQTVDETPKRDAVAKEQTESEEYKEGMFGEPSPELAEDMAVQAIEGPVTIDIAHEIYSDYDGMNKAGVIFFENQTSGAEKPGIWIGIKEPDERVDEFVERLQEKVDAGEILARFIHIFKSDYTQEDLNKRMTTVHKAVGEFAGERGSYNVSVQTLTGEVDVGHDFLSEEQLEKLREEFPDYTIHFIQEGSMVAKPGESTLTYPEETFTSKHSTEGGYVMQVYDEGMLVIEAEPENFGETGGDEEFFSAISYTYEEAASLKVGQRVHVENTGGVMDSYPGQATAKFVEILPEYKPARAVLSESEVVREAIQKKKSDDMVIIHSLVFDEKTSTWIVNLKQEEGVYEVKIKDE